MKQAFIQAFRFAMKIIRAIITFIKPAALFIDRAIEAFAVSAVAAMTLLVTMQVITRKILNFVFYWGDEITLLLLIWFAFLGIAIGFRDKLHLAMDSFTRLFSPRWNHILDKVIALSVLGFGYYLIKYGWEFTVLVYPNKMSATEWSSSVMYIVMPITGVWVCFYSILHLLGIDTNRHKGIDDEVIGE
jgi:TRAP-type C4-dicarboxylate transport system permease small subunit